MVLVRINHKFLSRSFLLKKVPDREIEKKNYWLIPQIIMLILLGLLVLFAEITGLGPFIYPFI